MKRVALSIFFILVFLVIHGFQTALAQPVDDQSKARRTIPPAEVYEYETLQEGQVLEKVIAGRQGDELLQGKATQIIRKEIKLNGEAVTPVDIELTLTYTKERADGPAKTRSENRRLTLFTKRMDDGVALIGYQFPNSEAITYQPGPIYVVKNPLRAGASWQDSITRFIIPNLGESTAPVELPSITTCTVEAVDASVTVPAGAYHDCLRIACREKVDVSAYLQGVSFHTYEDVYWQAKGVGTVMSMAKESHLLADGREVPLFEKVYKLTSFKSGK